MEEPFYNLHITPPTGGVRIEILSEGVLVFYNQISDLL